MKTRADFMPIEPGATVAYQGKDYRIEKILDAGTVLGVGVLDGNWQHINVAATTLPSDTSTAVEAPPHPDLVGSEEDYDEAQRRLSIIRPMLEARGRSEKMVKAHAKASSISSSTLYDWMKQYSTSEQLASLIPRKRGRPEGMLKLDAEREAIIAAAIEKVHKTRKRHRVTKTVEAVQEMCRDAKVAPPSPNTVRSRVDALPKAEVLRSRGLGDLARDTLQPILGPFPGADLPQSVYQMDHCLFDIQLVEDQTRLALGRPWGTVVIDVHSRMIAGIVISMESPSAFAAGSCVAQAMLPKEGLLSELGIEGEWVVWGKPSTVLMDNAREFRGNTLKLAFAQYGIKLQLRPVKTPHYGGHIERFMGTIGEEIRILPGATFSSPEERKGLQPEKDAAMTLTEFTRYVVDWIVNVYHKRLHAGIGMTPVARWNDGIMGMDGRLGIGIPSKPTDPERLSIDFMPHFMKSVQRYGVRLDHVTYWDDILKLRITEKDPATGKARRFIVRRDPRDISRIWFHDPDTGLNHRIPTRDLTRPAVSIWEWRATRKYLKQRGEATQDEDAIFETILRLREQAAAAVLASKSARQAHHRSENARHMAAAAKKPSTGADATDRAQDAGTDEDTTKPTTTRKPIRHTADDDIFATAVEPFEVDDMVNEFRASLEGRDPT